MLFFKQFILQVLSMYALILYLTCLWIIFCQMLLSLILCCGLDTDSQHICIKNNNFLAKQENISTKVLSRLKCTHTNHSPKVHLRLLHFRFKQLRVIPCTALSNVSDSNTGTAHLCKIKETTYTPTRPTRTGVCYNYCSRHKQQLVFQLIKSLHQFSSHSS